MLPRPMNPSFACSAVRRFIVSPFFPEWWKFAPIDADGDDVQRVARSQRPRLDRVDWFVFSYQILVTGLLGFGRSGIGRKVFLRNRRSLFCEVNGSSKIGTDEPYLSVDITLQQYLSLFVRKLAMNRNCGCSTNGGDVTRQFTALLEAY